MIFKKLGESPDVKGMKEYSEATSMSEQIQEVARACRGRSASGSKAVSATDKAKEEPPWQRQSRQGGRRHNRPK